MRKYVRLFFLVSILLLNTMLAYAVELEHERELYGSWVENGERVLGVFPLSKCPLSVQELWATIMSGNADVIFQVEYSYSDLNTGNQLYCGEYRFYLVPPGATYSVETIDSSGGFAILRFSENLKYLSFGFRPKDSLFINSTSAIRESNGIRVVTKNGGENGEIVDRERIFRSSYFDNHAPTSGTLLDDWFFSVPEGPIVFETDLEPDIEPEPTPPPTPIRPDITQPPIGEPNFPKVEGEYIPYDTTVWNGFAGYVRNAIGSSTNIGLRVFGIIIAIWVVIRVIKLFTRVGQSEDSVDDDW